MPRKNKPQRTAYRQADGPTPERLAKGDFGKKPAPRIEGHDHGNVEVAYALPATHNWKRAGWIDEEQAQALEAWAEIEALCKWHISARDYAALNFGAVVGCRPEWRGDIRDKWRGIQSYLVDEFGELPVLCLMAWLTQPGQPDYARAFPHGRNKARTLAAAFIEAAAEELRRLLK